MLMTSLVTHNGLLFYRTQTIDLFTLNNGNTKTSGSLIASSLSKITLSQLLSLLHILVSPFGAVYGVQPESQQNSKTIVGRPTKQWKQNNLLIEAKQWKWVGYKSTNLIHHSSGHITIGIKGHQPKPHKSASMMPPSLLLKSSQKWPNEAEVPHTKCHTIDVIYYVSQRKIFQYKKDKQGVWSPRYNDIVPKLHSQYNNLE